MKFLTSFTSLAFAPCKKDEERRGGGFFSTAKGSSNPAAFSEVEKLLINGLIEHDSFPNAQQVSVSKGEDKEFRGNKVPGLERNTSSQP